jgi:hypothetical protein
VVLTELLELIAVFRVVGVHVVEDAERTLAKLAGGGIAATVMLLLGLYHEDGRQLALGAVLALGERGVGLRVGNVVGE